MIFSDTFKGAGLVSGGPYNTDKYLPFSGVFSPLEEIVRDPVKLSQDTAQDARNNSELGLVDPVSNIKNQPMYILSNTDDYLVPPELH